MKGNVYLVTVVENAPPVQQRDQGAISSVVIGPMSEIAESRETAALKIGLKNPNIGKDYDIDRLEVVTQGSVAGNPVEE